MANIQLGHTNVDNQGFYDSICSIALAPAMPAVKYFYCHSDYIVSWPGTKASWPRLSPAGSRFETSTSSFLWKYLYLYMSAT